MKLTNLNDVEAFKKVIADCESDVWMVDSNGNILDLKDEIGCYIASAELLKEINHGLSLHTTKQIDKYRLMRFFSKIIIREAA